MFRVNAHPPLLSSFDALIADAGEDFQAEVASFKEMQVALAEACTRAPQHPTCMFYRLSDLQYFGLLSPRGYAPNLGVDGLSLADARAQASLALSKA